MKKGNICKFVGMGSESDLIVKQFIYETENPVGVYDRMLAYDRMILGVTGSALLTVGGNNTEISAGTLAFLFSGQKVSLTPDSDFTYMYIDFRGKRALSLYDKFGVNAVNYQFQSMTSLVPIWREALVNAESENIDLLSESMILYTFSKLSGKHRKDENDRAIILVLDYINENFSSPTLSLSKMAKDLGYNPKYLSHLISKETSVCFTDYLRNLRMKNAVILIEQGVTSIKNLAVLSGYANPLYFSKAFKETFGVSPKNYVNDISKNDNNK